MGTRLNGYLASSIFLLVSIFCIRCRSRAFLLAFLATWFANRTCFHRHTLAFLLGCCWASSLYIDKLGNRSGRPTGASGWRACARSSNSCLFPYCSYICNRIMGLSALETTFSCMACMARLHRPLAQRMATFYTAISLLRNALGRKLAHARSPVKKDGFWLAHADGQRQSSLGFVWLDIHLPINGTRFDENNC